MHYYVYLDSQKQEAEQETKQKEKELQEAEANKIEQLEKEKEIISKGIEIAEKSIEEGNSESFLHIWSHVLKKSLMENYIFCAMIAAQNKKGMAVERKPELSEEIYT